jgi:hypothetical protein
VTDIAGEDLDAVAITGGQGRAEGLGPSLEVGGVSGAQQGDDAVTGAVEQTGQQGAADMAGGAGEQGDHQAGASARR